MLSGRLLQPVACGKPSVPGRAGLGQEEFLGPAPLLTSHLPPPPPPRVQSPATISQCSCRCVMRQALPGGVWHGGGGVWPGLV